MRFGCLHNCYNLGDFRCLNIGCTSFYLTPLKLKETTLILSKMSVETFRTDTIIH